MINMIHAGVPGVYAFFRGEERGGIGSHYCAQHRKELFTDIKCAIAFDRKGTKSIITHQGRGRGCSDEFANSLAAIIGMGHVCDATGIYTDTAEFFDLVPNCTNVSVGYANEHSKNETLDEAYIIALKNHLIEASWSKLDHTPKKPDVKPSNSLFAGIPQICAEDIADFIYDNCQILPKDLQDLALTLAQKIYKRFDKNETVQKTKNKVPS